MINKIQFCGQFFSNNSKNKMDLNSSPIRKFENRTGDTFCRTTKLSFGNNQEKLADLEKNLELGRKALKKGNYLSAVRYYEKGIRKAESKLDQKELTKLYIEASQVCLNACEHLYGRTLELANKSLNSDIESGSLSYADVFSNISKINKVVLCTQAAKKRFEHKVINNYISEMNLAQLEPTSPYQH